MSSHANACLIIAPVKEVRGTCKEINVGYECSSYVFVGGLDDLELPEADVEGRAHQRAVLLLHHYYVYAPAQCRLCITY